MPQALRLSKIVLVASLAAFCFIVTYDNIVDYGSNYAFVQHVLSMDTTFPTNTLRSSRAITSPVLWRAAYALIIGMEGLSALAFVIGVINMARRFWAPAERFHAAKRLVVIGATLAFLLFFTGFMVVGGEYFAMWQSAIWNGQQAAYRFYVTVLAVLIFVVMPEGTRTEP